MIGAVKLFVETVGWNGFFYDYWVSEVVELARCAHLCFVQVSLRTSPGLEN
jgi:hypothetical protein